MLSVVRISGTVSVTQFAVIALIVFLTSTQPFYLRLAAGVDHSKLGAVIGQLGTADELVSMVVAPYVGTLVDGGRSPRNIQVLGFALIALSFLAYGKFSHPLVIVFVERMTFAIGISSVLTMATVYLNQIASIVGIRSTGRYSAMVGIASGLGAIFAVAAFTTLPTRIGKWTDKSEVSSVMLAYVVVSGFALLAGIFTAGFAPREGSQVSVRKSPLRSLVDGFEISKRDRRAQLAIAGGLVARSASVANAVFVPLFVFKWFADQGYCRDDEPLDRFGCADGFKFAAMLTGVSQTVALVTSPIWGILNDRYESTIIVAGVGILGVVASFSFAMVSSPKSAAAFITAALLGCAQLGSIITSMSIMSKIGNRGDDEEEHAVIGTLSGLLSLAGSVGILALSIVGGGLSDKWVHAPFVLIGVCYAGWLAVAVAHRRLDSNVPIIPNQPI